MKISVAGVGYVGLSIAVLLAQHNEVTALTTTPQKVELLQNKISPIKDAEIEDYLKNRELKLTVTTDRVKFYQGAEYIVVATPTDYDPVKNYFDTSTVEEVIKEARSINPEAVIVIKSTVPVGYTERLREEFKTDKIIFSPEFLREGKALYDNLYPSRIIVGERSARARKFAGLLVEGAIKKDVPVLFTNPTEADDRFRQLLPGHAGSLL